MSTSTTKRVALYVRVSDDDQNHQLQLDELRAYVEPGRLSASTSTMARRAGRTAVRGSTR